MMFMLVQVLIINLQMHLFYIIFTKEKESLLRFLFSFCLWAPKREKAQTLRNRRIGC